MITAELLVKAKLCEQGAAEKWAPLLDAAAKRYDIVTKDRVVGFLSQCAHESGNFRTLEENLNYSHEALARVFPKYFTPVEAAQYSRRPEKIANRVYANRMGNASEASGDGWKYRGRGLIQLTGKGNYKAYATALNKPEILSTPELLAKPEHAALSAAWFWGTHGLNKWADLRNVDEMTKIINGGTNGLDHRRRLYEQVAQAFVA